MDDKVTLENVLQEFVHVNQQAFHALETLGLVLDCVEIILVPTERRMIVRVKEYAGNSLKTHQVESSLKMTAVNVEDVLAKNASPGISIRHVDARNLTHELIDKIITGLEAKSAELS